MKAIGLTILILAASLARAVSPTLPEGTYSGTANWRGPAGSGGSYTVERKFLGMTMSSHYTWTQPQPREETLVLSFAMKPGEPVFDVLDGKSQLVGSGYCYDDACAYRAAFGPVTVDETFRGSEGNVVVIGTKVGPGFSVVWKESLQSR